MSRTGVHLVARVVALAIVLLAVVVPARLADAQTVAGPVLVSTRTQVRRAERRPVAELLVAGVPRIARKGV